MRPDPRFACLLLIVRAPTGAVLLGVTCVACSVSTTEGDGGRSDGGLTDLGADLGPPDAGADVGIADSSSDGPGETCGAATCAVGMYCCNWGCGMDCRPSGAVCMGDCPGDAGVRYCGRLGGPSCHPGEFCNYPVGEMCGATDGSGVCTVVPAGCDTVYAPVCGCDGHDYSNACLAAAARTSVRSTGTCPPTDCTSTGCPPGSTCQACLGAMGVEYVCIGSGAAC